MYKNKGKKFNRARGADGLWSEDETQKHNTEPGPVKHIPVSTYLKENKKKERDHAQSK